MIILYIAAVAAAGLVYTLILGHASSPIYAAALVINLGYFWKENK